MDEVGGEAAERDVTPSSSTSTSLASCACLRTAGDGTRGEDCQRLALAQADARRGSDGAGEARAASVHGVMTLAPTQLATATATASPPRTDRRARRWLRCQADLARGRDLGGQRREPRDVDDARRSRRRGRRRRGSPPPLAQPRRRRRTRSRASTTPMIATPTPLRISGHRQPRRGVPAHRQAFDQARELELLEQRHQLVAGVGLDAVELDLFGKGDVFAQRHQRARRLHSARAPPPAPRRASPSPRPGRTRPPASRQSASVRRGLGNDAADPLGRCRCVFISASTSPTCAGSTPNFFFDLGWKTEPPVLHGVEHGDVLVTQPHQILVVR